MSCGVGGALFVAPFMSGFILTKFGRKTILILGESIMIVNLFILAGLSFANLDNASIAFIMICNNFLILIMLKIDCIGFGISLGPIGLFSHSFIIFNEYLTFSLALRSRNLTRKRSSSCHCKQLVFHDRNSCWILISQRWNYIRRLFHSANKAFY